MVIAELLINNTGWLVGFQIVIVVLNYIPGTCEPELNGRI